MSFTDILLQLFHGVSYTVLITVTCSFTGLLVGLTVVGLRRLSIPKLRFLLDTYTYVFRAVPVLVLLFMVYFGLPMLGLKVSPILAINMSLGLIASAYIAEVFRGALDLVDASEIIAAQSMGMTRLQVLRYIEFPQMLRFAFPGLINEFTTVLKYSPFAYTVGIPEITKQAMTLTATSMRGVEIYFAVGILYFVIYRTLLVSLHLLERYFRVPGIAPK